MNQDSKNNRLSDSTCAKVTAESSPAELFNEFYKLHVEINGEQGQIVAHATEAEQVLESRLAQIKKLRHSVKGKQQRLKILAERCGISLNELLTSR